MFCLWPQLGKKCPVCAPPPPSPLAPPLKKITCGALFVEPVVQKVPLKGFWEIKQSTGYYVLKKSNCLQSEVYWQMTNNVWHIITNDILLNQKAMHMVTQVKKKNT